jgi:putative transposase
MIWKALLGNGKAWTGRKGKRRWRPNVWGPARRIGEKNGRKKSVLVDERGVPLSIVASGANVHDVKLLAATLDAVVLQRPAAQQHLCGDAGYTGKPAHQAIVARHYQPHIRARGEEKIIRKKGYRARRWVVERTHSWLNRFRKLLVSFEKTEASYLGLLFLACGLIAWRQTIVIYG